MHFKYIIQWFLNCASQAHKPEVGGDKYYKFKLKNNNNLFKNIYNVIIITNDIEILLQSKNI